MADSKRNNAVGKVATPKPGASTAQPMLDTLEALGKAIGARIKLTTAAPHAQSYEGTLFTACPLLNIVAINTRTADSSAPQSAGDYHLIPISRIQTFHVVELAGSGAESNGYATAQPLIGPVDIKRLEKRAADRVRQLQEEEKNLGKGVTKEAQAIYDSFKRINMPIRWHNQEMIVHEAVIVAPPYRGEDCKGAKDKQEVLNRVKKVLEGERRKIREREERERKPAAGNGPRKGG